MRLTRFMLATAAITTAWTLAASPIAAADTSSDPAGSSSTGSVESVAAGHGIGLGDFNRTVSSSYGLHDSPAPTGGAKVLVFGDSHTGGTITPLYTDDRGCMHSRRSWPQQLAALMHFGPGELIDASCWGSGINTGHGIPFADQVRYAEGLGGLGVNTKDIIIQLGYNDAWSGHGVTLLEATLNCLFDRGHCNADGAAAGKVINPADITAQSWAQRAKPVVDYLRYYAPNARIHVMGYQSLVPAGDMCINIGGVRKPVRGTEILGEDMRRIDDAARGGAQILGLDFIDLRRATEGHESCSDTPWVDGIADPRVDTVAMVMHPSTRGNAAAAELIRDTINAAAATTTPTADADTTTPAQTHSN